MVTGKIRIKIISLVKKVSSHSNRAIILRAISTIGREGPIIDQKVSDYCSQGICRNVNDNAKSTGLIVFL